jgi:tetratricopeptide (TPR) repeat protein
VSVDDLLHLFLNFGRALELSGQYPRALDCYEHLEHVAQDREDKRLLLASLTARSVLLSIPTSAHDPEESRRLATRALGLAREISDAAAEARILWCLLLIDSFGGHLAQAIASGEESMELCRKIGSKEQLAFTLHDLVLPYWTLGKKDKALAALDEVEALWLELGNQPMQANSLGRRAQFENFAGAFERARAVAEESLQISRKIGNLSGVSLGQTLLGLVSLEQGGLGRAIDSLREAVDRGMESDNLLAATGVKAELAWALSCAGAFEEGLELAEQAVAEAQEHIGHFVDWCRAIRLRIRLRMVTSAEHKEFDFEIGEAEQAEAFFMGGPGIAAATVESALALGDLDAALARSDRHLHYLDHMGVRSQRPYALYLRSKVLLERASNDQARESLEEARQLAETMGARYALWMILDGLSRIAEAQGDPQTSSSLRSQARSILGDIAAGIDNQAYRATFLSLPDVGRIMAEETSGDSPTH